MRNNGQYQMIQKPQKEESQRSESKTPLLSDTQKGLISIGVVAGAALAISKKKSVLAIIGYMWLGSIAGGGLGYLFSKKKEHEKQSN